jgi:hypothetical protein
VAGGQEARIPRFQDVEDAVFPVISFRSSLPAEQMGLLSPLTTVCLDLDTEILHGAAHCGYPTTLRQPQGHPRTRTVRTTHKVPENNPVPGWVSVCVGVPLQRCWLCVLGAGDWVVFSLRPNFQRAHLGTCRPCPKNKPTLH